MPPALRKRERVDYCEAPRAKRVKLDAPAPQPSKPNRPKQTPKKQGQAPKVATQAAPTPIPPPSQRKRQEKNNHTPIGAGEAPNRGRKRKRDAEKEIDVQQEPEAPSIPQPLTKENLRAFDEATGMAKTTSRQPTKSGIESQTKEGTSRSKKLSHQGVAEVLKKHRIFIDRKLPMPDEVMTLVTLMLEGSFALRSTRGCTPTSSRVADSIPWVSQLQELGAQQHLQDVLGYPSECEMGKDPALAQTSIWRDWNRRWRMQSVPLRDYQKDELETCCENAGLPPTPQPDIMYGYMAHCFSQTMQDWLDHHGDIIVLSNGPILPYWVVEWKSTATGGNMFQAKTQARRDGAAAVYAMHRMYEAWGFANPPPEHTAIFSMSVDAEHACIIIHWRFADEDGVVSYEAERVKTCLLSDAVSVYHLRSIIFNMLQWARDTRLPHMRKMFKERKILKDRVEGSQVESTTASLSGEAHGKVAISEQDNETTQTEAGQSSDNIDSLTITVEGTSGGSEGRTPLKALSVNSSTGETAPAEDRGDEQSMPPPPKRQCKSLTAKPSRTMSKKKHDPKALATHSHTS